MNKYSKLFLTELVPFSREQEIKMDIEDVYLGIANKVVDALKTRMERTENTHPLESGLTRIPSYVDFLRDKRPAGVYYGLVRGEFMMIHYKTDLVGSAKMKMRKGYQGVALSVIESKYNPQVDNTRGIYIYHNKDKGFDKDINVRNAFSSISSTESGEGNSALSIHFSTEGGTLGGQIIYILSMSIYKSKWDNKLTLKVKPDFKVEVSPLSKKFIRV